MLALASPGNPTGWTATADDWRRLIDFCERHDLWLMADGVYERIIFDGRVAPSPLAWPEGRDRTIVTQSLSKAYRMTGWRLGYSISPPSIAQVMTDLQEFVVSNAPGIIQEAARAALDEGEAFIAESQARYARHFRLTVDRLRGIEGLIPPTPTGAFYVFPKLEGLVDSFDFCDRLVRGARGARELPPARPSAPAARGTSGSVSRWTRRRCSMRSTDSKPAGMSTAPASIRIQSAGHNGASEA